MADPRLATAEGVEVVDHVSPGVIVLGVSGIVLAATRLARISGGTNFGAGLIVTLAGL